jgi:hypothetical protein
MRAFLSIVALLLGGCGSCGNDPINAEASPDKKHMAIAFIRDCGATTEFSTQVSILPAAGKLPNESGNVLVVEGKQPVAVRWESSKVLVIAGSANSRAHLKQSAFDNISIRYE